MVSALVSCGSSNKLVTNKVAYQSIRMSHPKPKIANGNLEKPKIQVGYAVTENGNLSVAVYNPTSEIMVIDQTMSFFVDTSGKSYSYFDPTVRTTSVTDLSSRSKGAGVNLGAVAGALGVGGFLGTLAGGITVGGESTTGRSVENATVVADQPKVSLAPKGCIFMSKNFGITGVGRESLKNSNSILPNIAEAGSAKTFSVCISYSLDGGKNFEKIVTDFYENSEIAVPVEKEGAVNEALRKIYTIKPDAIHEPLWLLYFSHNIISSPNIFVQGALSDYQ